MIRLNQSCCMIYELILCCILYLNCKHYYIFTFEQVWLEYGQVVTQWSSIVGRFTSPMMMTSARNVLSLSPSNSCRDLCWTHERGVTT